MIGSTDPSEVADAVEAAASATHNAGDADLLTKFSIGAFDN